MQYIDPYDFLGLQVKAPIEIDRAMLYYARKKLLANFQLAENGMMEWQGQEIGLSQALAIADQMEDGPTRLNYWRIRQSPSVLAFLKSGQMQAALAMELLSLRQTQNCFELIQPFWIPAISNALRTAIHTQQDDQRQHALAMVAESHFEDDPEVWKGVAQWATIQTAEMKAATKGLKTSVLKAQFEYYSNATVCELLNRLPDRYDEVSDEYAKALVHLAWDYYEATKMLVIAWKAVKGIQGLHLSASTRAALRPIIDRLRELARPLDQRALMESIMSQFQAMPPLSMQPPPQEERNWGGLWGSMVMLGLLVGALVFLKGLGGGGSSSGIDMNQFKMPDLNFDPHSFDRVIDGMELRRNGAQRLYDSLWHHPIAGKVVPTGMSERPENGANVYGFHTFPQSFRTQKLVVQNRSSKDMVLMIEESKGHKLVDAVYLRSKGDTVTIDLASEMYCFRSYTGKNWVSSLMQFDGRPIPGFSKGVTFVGNHPDIYDEKYQRQAPMTLGTMTQVPEGHTVKRLTFDGKSFEWGWQ